MLDRRTPYRNIDAEIEIVTRYPKAKGVSVLHVRIRQSGQRRRFEHLMDSAERSVYLTDFDADTVQGYSRGRHSSLDIFSNADADRRIMDFDPRILGMTSSSSHLTTVEQCLLMHEEDASIELLTPTEEAGSKVERVKISEGPYSSEYWITEPKHQLLRRIISFGPNSGATVLSEYDPKVANGDLPVTVVIRNRQPGNQSDQIIKVRKLTTDADIPDEAFSIMSIGLPVNTMINDYRKNRITGYWTGAGIAEGPVAAAETLLAQAEDKVPAQGQAEKQAPPAQPAEGHDARLRALVAEKLKVMRDGAEISLRQFRSARVELQEVIDWQIDLRGAELDACTTDQERIAVWKRSLDEAKDLEQMVQAKRLFAQATPTALMRATAYRLDAEIALERLNAK